MGWVEGGIALTWMVIGFVVLWRMAESRGRHRWFWGAFGMITFIFAAIIIAIAGPAKDRGTATV